MKELYPFKSQFLELDGVRYHYVDEGIGEPLVMVHGNPTWSFHFRNLITDLRSRYRVVAPDHIGLGLSDKPKHYNYELQQHVANLTALIQKLGLRNITLVMHDWGGPISMGYAVEHPQNISRFIVFNTAAFWLPRIHRGLQLLQVSPFGSWIVRRLNLFVLSGIYLGCRRTRMSKEARSGYMKPYDTFDRRIGVLRFIQDIPLREDHKSYPLLRSIEDNLDRLKGHKMMIIWGGLDPVFDKRFLQKWTEHFPNSTLRLVEDGGHYIVEDAHDLIVPWIEAFLKQPEEIHHDH